MCPLEDMEIIKNFFKNKKVLITGHTGFKGTWLSKILIDFGADVTGYSLSPLMKENLFNISKVEKEINSVIGDVRDLTKMQKVFSEVNPEIVFHLAAQPLVRESYKNPIYTFETNIMGTVNVLECVRKSDSVKSFLNITTDKVYYNNEWEWGYRENERLEGFDPYSNSKSCSELVTHSYKNSFFSDTNVAISTARAGNVIGGGDFSVDRIIPDCVRAGLNQKEIIVRNPNSIRPYQHVLEPLNAYLQIIKKQYEDIKYSDSYNVGPNEDDCITTSQLVTRFCEIWGEGLKWRSEFDNGPHESSFLKLDCSKIKRTLNWKPHWNIDEALKKTIDWTKCYRSNADVEKCMTTQIKEFFN